jgi:hypothetical protein
MMGAFKITDPPVTTAIKAALDTCREIDAYLKDCLGAGPVTESDVETLHGMAGRLHNQMTDVAHAMKEKVNAN